MARTIRLGEVQWQRLGCTSGLVWYVKSKCFNNNI